MPLRVKTLTGKAKPVKKKPVNYKHMVQVGRYSWPSKQGYLRFRDNALKKIMKKMGLDRTEALHKFYQALGVEKPRGTRININIIKLPKNKKPLPKTKRAFFKPKQTKILAAMARGVPITGKTKLTAAMKKKTVFIKPGKRAS